ncbi:AI-2E family transporter [Dyella halodurans]|uniref:AI-2E family transporter n=1 Tax=Dyella halodurans TaxID=1920171 RepID=A0ABV9C1P8_9GAMM|nr:AI-2E family transporter [Dyella halodurans]
MASESQVAPPASPSQRAITIIASATILALLYFGREVLVPIALALFLSLLMDPWVRLYRRLGMGHGLSVFIAVLALVVIVTGLTTVIGSQVVHMARSLPQYQATIHSKAQTLRAMTVGRMEAVQGEFGKVINLPEARNAYPPLTSPTAPSYLAPTAPSAEPVQAPTPNTPTAVITRILSTVWIPLQTAGIVLVVLVFVLLEHESLRDRFIRLVGGADLRASTAAINDAGERLSRFFVSTFSVNFGVGAAIWLGLSLMGLPGAPLWGVLTAVLRFVPYVGVWMVAVLAAVFAAAVVPGWSLLLMTLALFLVVELVVSQLVEPLLYGHTTGLSPLAIVVAAIFWSWLWGPVGLIMSTPLTLCLVVAGRHIKALDLLSILLGDAPALTMPQRLYQRALSGDSQEIIAEAREFLKRKSFAAYCDAVLLPAMQLARIDLTRGAINREQQEGVRHVIVTVVETLGGEARRWSSRRRPSSVLDDVSIGRRLRQQRENISGRWQGPLSVAPESVVLCVGLGSMADDLATEILTRILRNLHIDARHLSTEDFIAFEAELHPELTPNAVSMVYIVSADPARAAQGDALAGDMRVRFPHACIVAVLLPELLSPREELAPVGADVNEVVESLEAAALQAIARFPKVGEDTAPSARRSRG